MAQKIDLIAPQPPVPHGLAAHSIVPSSAMMVQRWLKNVGDKIVEGEPLIELAGNQVVFYVHAQGHGTLSKISVAAGQNVLSGHVLGQISVVSKEEIEWDNLDHVTEMLTDFAQKAKDFNGVKDAVDALGQLLGVAENQVFFNMKTEEQNQFLQSVIDQSEAGELSPADIARKMLVDLNLRPPQFTPYAPQAPNFGLGMRPPTPAGPGGMGGGMGGGQYNPAAYYPQQQAGQIAYPPNNTMPPSGHYDPNLSGVGAIPQPNAYPSYPVAPTHPVGGFVPPPQQTHNQIPNIVPPSEVYPIEKPQLSEPDSNDDADHKKPE